MAEDKKGQEKSSSGLIGRASAINRMLTGLVRRTYYSSDDPRNALEVIRRDADEAIDNVVKQTTDINGTNISSLYTRAYMRDGIKQSEIQKGLNDMFEDKSMLEGVLSTYMENKYIRNIDLEIDTILKYMPQLEHVLEAKKDSILSADNFSKDFININSDTKISGEKDAAFKTKVDEIKSNYKIIELFDTAYDHIAKYGEEFIYCVPYNKAIGTLMEMAVNESGSKSTNYVPYKGITESHSFDVEVTTINEGKVTSENKQGAFTVKFNSSNRIESVLKENVVLLEQKHKIKMYDKEQEVDFDFKSFGKGQEGLIDDNNKEALNLNGGVVKRLKRENVIPLYIDEMCIGYYYIETERDDMFDYVENMHDPYNSLKRSQGAIKKQQKNIKDETIKNLAKNISDQIDKKFVNANQDLSKEIYLILKHNKMMNEDTGEGEMIISFVPPSEMHHLYFKKDPKTNRGISDLANSFIPAKLYTAMLISNTIGILTRSQDKRAYFVRQNIDTNISEVMLSVINQIKKSNFGRRELNDLDNIFNVVGKGNDFVIPTTQGGERPIDFEIISGQDIDTKDELMDQLEDMAVKPMGVPREILDMNDSVEFATRLVMANVKFLRHVVKRQSILQIHFSNVVTSIYNMHFGENEKLTVVLPPPSHLNLNNINEMWSNAQNFVDQIVELELTDTDRDNPDFEQIFRRNLMRYYLATYVDWAMIDSIKKNSEIESKRESGGDDEGY